MSYNHIQRGSLHYLLYGTSAIVVAGAWFCRGEPPMDVVLAVMGLCVLPIAWAFGTLTVEDAGDRLLIRYGPLPLFWKRIFYADITGVEPDRSKLIDGWGIHYVPGRGTTYNLWGFDCVKLTLGKKVVRIGSDDVENLVEFLRTKTPPE